MIYEVRGGKEEELDDLFSTISSSSGVLCFLFFPSWAHVAAGEEFPPPSDLCAAAPALRLGKPELWD